MSSSPFRWIRARAVRHAVGGVDARPDLAELRLARLAEEARPRTVSPRRARPCRRAGRGSRPRRPLRRRPPLRGRGRAATWRGWCRSRRRGRNGRPRRRPLAAAPRRARPLQRNVLHDHRPARLVTDRRLHRPWAPTIDTCVRRSNNPGSCSLLKADRRYPLLLIAVFLSGASALMFETLWFRLCGLMFGSGVWASSLVLAGFMTGLAVGNGLSGRVAARLRRPLVVYAGLEVADRGAGARSRLAVAGPHRAHGAPLQVADDAPAALNALRLVTAFVLMLAPAAAMGATLPTPGQRDLRPAESAFGQSLGRLYGWNTMGAVAGALAGETFALGASACGAPARWPRDEPHRGVHRLLALPAAGRAPPAPSVPRRADSRRPLAWRPLLAASVCGAILLALEVLWFRFLTVLHAAHWPQFASSWPSCCSASPRAASGGPVVPARSGAARFLAPPRSVSPACPHDRFQLRPVRSFGDRWHLHGARDVLPFAIRLCFPVCRRVGGAVRAPGHGHGADGRAPGPQVTAASPWPTRPARRWGRPWPRSFCSRRWARSSFWTLAALAYAASRGPCGAAPCRRPAARAGGERWPSLRRLSDRARGARHARPGQPPSPRERAAGRDPGGCGEPSSSTCATSLGASRCPTA